MRKMWRDSLEESRRTYQESRAYMIERYKHQVSRALKISCLLLTIFLFSCNSTDKNISESATYTCSMHPEIVEDKPGTCPICGMDLTKIHTKTAINLEVDSSVMNALSANNDSFTNNLETIVVKESTLKPSVNLNGTITYNSNQIKTISARVSGRIEKSYVKYNFEPIKKGQLLLKVYSPELLAIQQELLYLKSKNENALLNQTKTKLLLLGVSNQQINKVLKSGKADDTINIYSNYSGYLLNASTDSNDDLQTANTTLMLTDGLYINTGDLLYKVFNDNELWAIFYTNTSESEWVKSGDKIELTIDKKNIAGKVSLVQPFYKNNQNLTEIRVVLNNRNNQFKIGQLANATVSQNSITGIWIPEAAVYQLGEKSIVFIKKDQVLKAITINVTAKANKQVLVKDLKPGDEIANNASYMIDSESFIKINTNE
ncbi:HlyD family efflux transporter periplasmic adaptor subunit [Pedobacter alpinus]|uniref:HlyD family efflux transporter periplasmic adaptor subunit n=1 Tax=Pedobacter alpinus TaxID=1590643 RepID=A0ABW5TV52_9SPHI